MKANKQSEDLQNQLKDAQDFRKTAEAGREFERERRHKLLSSLAHMEELMRRQDIFCGRLHHAATDDRDSLACGVSKTVWRRAANILRAVRMEHEDKPCDMKVNL